MGGFGGFPEVCHRHGVDGARVARFPDAVAGDGFWSRFGGGCVGGWCCSACGSGSDDVVGGADRDCPDVAAPAAAPVATAPAAASAPTPAPAPGVPAGGLTFVRFVASSAGDLGGSAGGVGAGCAVDSRRGGRWVVGSESGDWVYAGGGAA